MDAVFYAAAAVAVAATGLAISRTQPVHALLYLIVSLLAVAVVLLTMGAYFVAALEVIIYAGAIMVLFVFVIMMLNVGPHTEHRERLWLQPGVWVGPGLLMAVLVGELAWALWAGRLGGQLSAGIAEPRQVGLDLFTTYVLGVELASLLLLAALVGAYHLGRREERQEAAP